MSKQNEIFESNKAYDNILDSDNEDNHIEEKPLKTIHEVPDQPVIKKDKRFGKRKNPISEKQKAILLDNLARGREKALETRRKNAELRRIEREQKMSDKDELILESLNKRKLKQKSNDQLLQQITDLENKLKEQELKSVPKPDPKPDPKPEPEQKPKPKPKPEPEPEPVVLDCKHPNILSKKELLKLMKSNY